MACTILRIHKNSKFEIYFSKTRPWLVPSVHFGGLEYRVSGCTVFMFGSPYNIVPSVFATPIQRNRNFICGLRTVRRNRIPWKLPPEGCQLFLCSYVKV